MRDIGERFGCGAHVTLLRRLSVSPFDAQTMVSIEQIQSAGNADDFLRPTDDVIADWPSLTIDDETALKFRHGSKPDYSAPDTEHADELFRVYNSDNFFLGLGKVVQNKLETVRLIGGQLDQPATPGSGS